MTSSNFVLTSAKTLKTRFPDKIRRKRAFHVRFSALACKLWVLTDKSRKNWIADDFGQEFGVRSLKFGQNRKIGQNRTKFRKFFSESVELRKLSTLAKFQVKRLIWGEIMANQRFQDFAWPYGMRDSGFRLWPYNSRYGWGRKLKFSQDVPI